MLLQFAVVPQSPLYKLQLATVHCQCTAVLLDCSSAIIQCSSAVVCTLQRKSHLCIPFLGIARPQSQFPHSFDCDRFMSSQDWSTYFLQQNWQIDRGNKITDTFMCKLGLWPRNSWEYLFRVYGIDSLLCMQQSALVCCGLLYSTVFCFRSAVGPCDQLQSSVITVLQFDLQQSVEQMSAIVRCSLLKKFVLVPLYTRCSSALVPEKSAIV